MIHSVTRFYDQHELAFTIVTWIWVFSVFVMNARLGLRKPRHNIVVALNESKEDGGGLEISVVKHSRRPTTIRSASFDIYSDDLTSSTKRELRQRVILTESPGTVLTDSEPRRFRLKRPSIGSTTPQTVNLRELAVVLSDLGVETADVTGVVVDEKGFVYLSTPLHLPVYRVVPAIGPATQTNPQSAAE